MHKILFHMLAGNQQNGKLGFKRICEKPRYSLLVNKINTEMANLDPPTLLICKQVIKVFVVFLHS